MKKTLMYYVTIILTILFVLVNTYSYASEITKESLEKFFKEFVEKETEEGSLSGNIEIVDDKIVISSEETEDIMYYDLTDKPTFTIEMKFKNGMTYDECTEEAGKSAGTILGFMAVAGIKGADPENAMMYGMLAILGNAFNEGEDATVINEENFIDAVDYVEKSYSKDIEIVDDMFIMTTKKAELNGEEYIVKTELVVNEEALVNDKVDEVENTVVNSIVGGLSNTITSIANQIITTTNTVTNSTVNELATSTPSTANIGTMPNAGFELNLLTILKVVLGLSLAGIIVYSVYNKRYSSK